ncbi:hypothetical protein C0989_009695 [Termitomyces sp. Mn162]|nr:hypothetical protein C0989_009695 [Termitomyces sp. Mn162]
MEFEKEFQAGFFLLDPAKTAALSLQDWNQYGQVKQLLDKYIDLFHALVEQVGYPGGLQLCLIFCNGVYPSLMDCIESMAEEHADHECVDTYYKVACKQWQLMELQHEMQWTQHPTLLVVHSTPKSLLSCMLQWLHGQVQPFPLHLILLPSMPLYQLSCLSYFKEFPWKLTPPNSNSLLLCCVDVAERLTILPITILRG